MKDEALRMALEALESCDQVYGSEGSYQYFSQSMVDKAITAIQQALAAPVQEPHKSLSEHLAQATNGRVYVDPVTGDVGIGTPAAQQEPMEVDQATMELAESVGLIGPASRTHDLHAAIQRFHDLICVNATIKAAKMAADAIRESTPPAAAPVEDVDWKEQYEKQKRRSDMWVAKYEKDIGPIEYAAPAAAQPAPVPDAIHHTDLSETLEYIQGWNDCRAEILKGMKP